MLIIPAERLTAIATTIIKVAGSGDEEAQAVANNLVEANLKGHDSHGVGMVPRYVKAVKEGGLLPNQTVAIVRDHLAMLQLDGCAGYGQVIGRQAMVLGIERATMYGVCVVGLHNTHHLARIGAWAEQCATAGLVSVHFVNVLARPIVAPFGGSDARHGTNPFCVALPGIPAIGDKPAVPPILLDFATSRVAQGKMRVAHNKGQKVAPGLLLDDKGKPTLDPCYAVVEPTGAILPFGEHKGSGLALICELLGGAMSGGRTWRGAGDGKARVQNGMLSILMDPKSLGTENSMMEEVRSFVDWYRQSPPLDKTHPVELAGDMERNMIEKRSREGLPIDPTTWNEIVSAGELVACKRQELEYH